MTLPALSHGLLSCDRDAIPIHFRDFFFLRKGRYLGCSMLKERCIRWNLLCAAILAHLLSCATALPSSSWIHTAAGVKGAHSSHSFNKMEMEDISHALLSAPVPLRGGSPSAALSQIGVRKSWWRVELSPTALVAAFTICNLLNYIDRGMVNGVCVCVRARACLCVRVRVFVCVCVCERGREAERVRV
jgi:hypothetical protein